MIVRAASAEAVALISNVSKAFVRPIVPRVIVPLPERSVRASVLEPLPSASIVVKPPAAVAILIVPSLAVAPLPPWSVVIVTSPSITSAPFISTSPLTRAPSPLPLVVISPFRAVSYTHLTLPTNA